MLTYSKKFLRRKAIAIAAAFFVLAPFGAQALTVDPNRIPPARTFSYQMLHYLRFTLNYNDPLVINNSVQLGYLPPNCYIYAIDADVTTAFNSGSTDTLSLGVTSATHTEILGTSAVTITSTGITHATTAAGLGVGVTGNTSNQNTFGDVPLYVHYTSTGTAPSAGSITVLLFYVPNNDR